ncbi:hypothetical protein SDC9_38241 [bioreactor metagenome]|uniref:Uncharacterized protein n=1 Tax=bioreactor metagenome TaxID=1076179 RepID=A0A644VL56_9ZZZZ
MTDFLNVTSVTKDQNGKGRFRPIGVAFPGGENRNYLFKILLDANPVNGEIMAFVPQADAAAAGHRLALPDKMRVTTPVQGAHDRTRFTHVGIAFPASEGANYVFKAYLDAVPVNGELLLFPWEKASGSTAE